MGILYSNTVQHAHMQCNTYSVQNSGHLQFCHEFSCMYMCNAQIYPPSSLIRKLLEVSDSVSFSHSQISAVLYKFKLTLVGTHLESCHHCISLWHVYRQDISLTSLISLNS